MVHFVHIATRPSAAPRLQHQTTLDATGAGRWCPVKLAGFLTPGEHEIPLREQAISSGAKAGVASRLMAVRRPAAIGHERSSIARKKAKTKGSTPSPSHLERLAWHLCMTHGPHTIGKTATVVNV